MRDNHRLFKKDGSFKTEYPKTKGSPSACYLMNLTEWIYYREDLTDKEKLKDILILEKIIRKMVNNKVTDRFGHRVRDDYGRFIDSYKPKWSVLIKGEPIRVEEDDYEY